MNPILRAKYIAEFTSDKYQDFLSFLNQYSPTGKVGFRVAESPVFIPDALKQKLLIACEEIIDFIVDPNLKNLTAPALRPPQTIVPGEDEHTTFMQIDFGITKNESGELEPRLIEIQGFPTLYCFQALLLEGYKKCFNIPSTYTSLLNGYTPESYTELLRETIVGDTDPAQVVLLEIEPEIQPTNIDFYVTEKLLGIKVLCLTKLLKRGTQLYYIAEDGREIAIKKIYNRVIFDELNNRPDILERSQYKFTDVVDVEWIGHPAWFSRISKFVLPYIKSKYNPESYFLHELNSYPNDLENYVLKPIFSFAGTGVNLYPDVATLDAIHDKDNYILQRKVNYCAAVETPNVPAKCEIRMLTLWPKNAPRPIVVNNLIRLSKGEMIGVKFNKDKDWVGGTVGFFES